MLIINEYKRAWPERVFEIGYEDFALHPRDRLNDLLSFIKEDPGLMNNTLDFIHREQNKYKEKLTSEQIEFIKRECEPFYTQYHYQ